MRIFVTGGTGFIGGYVTELALKRGHELRCLARNERKTKTLTQARCAVFKGDVLDPDSLLGGMQGCDAVIHLANVYSFWESDARVYMRVNVEGTRNVMECALKIGVPKVVHVSSAVVFGVPTDVPFTEESTPRLVHATDYARSKYEGDRLCWQLYHQRALPLVSIYPGAVIGAGDVKPTGQYLQNLLEGKLPAAVFPRSVITLVYVRDVAEAIVRAAESEHTIGRKYLVGKERLSFADVNRMVQEISGVSIPGMVLPGPAVTATAALLTGIAAVTGKPPLWGLSRDMARIMHYGFRFDGSKAERELGIRYTPVRTALEEAIVSYRSS